MKIKEILTPSFRDYGIGPYRKPQGPTMWQKALSTESQFCRAVVGNGYLTVNQMQHAAGRYRLGASKQGGVIFWQIDQKGRVHDGKVMYYREDCHRDKLRNPTWISTILQRRYQWPDKPKGSHCLFGLHLLGNVKNNRHEYEGVAIVEAEKTAVIMSEIYPQYLWLATGGLGEVQAEKFRPLRGWKVVLFPDADPEGTAYRQWYKASEEVLRQIWWEGCPAIHVSPLLEFNSTMEQKLRKIDIVDYYFENNP